MTSARPGQCGIQESSVHAGEILLSGERRAYTMWGQQGMVGPIRSLGMKLRGLVLLFLISLTLVGGCATSVHHGRGTVLVTGELKQWHDVVLTFNGPRSDEADEVNPFLDYRLDVTFAQGDQQYIVPGYYAADGNAGQTGATDGNKWRVHFLPPEPGTWTYTASFRTGPDIALDSGMATAGQARKTWDAEDRDDHDRADGQDRPGFPGPGPAPLHRPAVSAIRPHRDVLHQGRGRQSRRTSSAMRISTRPTTART